MENKIIHITTPEDGADEAVTEVVWMWPKETTKGRTIEKSTWHRTGGPSDQFPKILGDKIEAPRITSCQLHGGQGGVKFELVNDVLLDNKTRLTKSVWIYCYRDQEQAKRNLAKYLKK